MSLLRFMTITSLVIVLLITFFSNLTPVLPLVFLGRSTVPIPLGMLVLGAFSTGLTTSLILRLLMFWQQPQKLRATKPEDFSYEPDPPNDRSWETAREQQNTAPKPSRRKMPERLVEPEATSTKQFKYVPPADSVYDANYRVISQPNTPAAPPQVGSKLRSDNEDWGFDFEEEEQPRT
jgi:hypothetical protein